MGHLEKEKIMSNKVYEIVQERILEALDKGTVPWHKPWKGGGLPMNLKSKKAYRGINVFMLAMQGRSSRYWVTFKQCKEMGGQIQKGEKHTMVVFWKRLKVEDKETGESKTIPMLRYYRVWNLDQCTGISDPDELAEPREHTPIEVAEQIIRDMPKRPEIVHEEQRAFYSRAKDLVNLPKPETFDGPEEYYCTAFHELGHATGHESRLDRKRAQDNAYAQEELVAEMCAAFLCGVTGIESKTLDNSAAYIDTWRKRIRDDVRLVVMAGAQAQKASDFIQGIEWKDKGKSE
jgi:antirestriction protein ArdC